MKLNILNLIKISFQNVIRLFISERERERDSYSNIKKNNNITHQINKWNIGLLYIYF